MTSLLQTAASMASFLKANDFLINFLKDSHIPFPKLLSLKRSLFCKTFHYLTYVSFCSLISIHLYQSHYENTPIQIYRKFLFQKM